MALPAQMRPPDSNRCVAVKAASRGSVMTGAMGSLGLMVLLDVNHIYIYILYGICIHIYVCIYICVIYIYTYSVCVYIHM